MFWTVWRDIVQRNARFPCKLHNRYTYMVTGIAQGNTDPAFQGEAKHWDSPRSMANDLEIPDRLLIQKPLQKGKTISGFPPLFYFCF